MHLAHAHSIIHIVPPQPTDSSERSRGRYFKTCNPDQNDPDNQIPLSSATDQPDLSRYFKTLLDWIRVILIPADWDVQIRPAPWITDWKQEMEPTFYRKRRS